VHRNGAGRRQNPAAAFGVAGALMWLLVADKPVDGR
jgi:hypothetical protein